MRYVITVLDTQAPEGEDNTETYSGDAFVITIAQDVDPEIIAASTGRPIEELAALGWGQAGVA